MHVKEYLNPQSTLRRKAKLTRLDRASVDESPLTPCQPRGYLAAQNWPEIG
jgi:hypothetical protein